MEAEADGFVVAQRAEVDMPVWLEDDAASADARADHAAQRPLVLRQPLERGVKRLAQPSARRAGIHMNDDIVALGVEHELRLAGPPQFREVGAEQEEAVERAALLRARVVDLAALGLVAVPAPDIGRLLQLGDADGLAAQRTGTAGLAGGGLSKVSSQRWHRKGSLADLRWRDVCRVRNIVSHHAPTPIGIQIILAPAWCRRPTRYRKPTGQQRWPDPLRLGSLFSPIRASCWSGLCPLPSGSYHLPRQLIIPLALVRDRPERAGLCPGQVCHLHDHLRSDPMHARQLKRGAEARLARRRLVERHTLHLQGSKHAGQALQLGFRED